MILNPRRMPACLNAIAALPIDKVWLQNYTERELEAVVPDVIAGCDHDLIGVLSDDTIPSLAALDAVLAQATHGEVTTGWCALDETSDLVNLSALPLTTGVPSIEAYTFPQRAWVQYHRYPRVPTYFAGHTLTFLWRSMWDEFGWEAYGPAPGCATDLVLSWKLQTAGIPIYAARDGYVQHVKARFNYIDHTPGRELLIGAEPSGVRWDLQGGTP